MEIWPCGNTNPIKVPLLNDVPLHYLKHHSLVKFRCLVQDIFDPEFYMGVYETVDPSPKANSYHLSMSLHTMNSLHLVPKKDSVANQLVSGALQLARNTALFLDEMQLEQGQLDTSGVRNIPALGNLISWQKVDYDFNYHKMEFPCNINVLITSEGRSLLPVRTEGVKSNFIGHIRNTI
ncbi:mini-chromosome maintenance complex-binding protein-like isoform 2-T2 [Salvelinus alpinus]|uniref:mini-chromosome maintenance complex-binding protein-like isoform X1 n=1 Tax=Salvelinus alpinus TaxID=8036 RepID=UPI0039FCB2FA